uniref:LITAF domain-containing protein n=1 Tax=Strongyloides venezuelensis TaxID=75913 RepID=A0A0K0F5Q2_STRVS
MKVELTSMNSDNSVNSSLASVTNSNIRKWYEKPNKKVGKTFYCNTCKQTASEREKVWFNLLVILLYLGFFFVTFLGISLIFRKPLCYILHGLLQYYTLE